MKSENSRRRLSWNFNAVETMVILFIIMALLWWIVLPVAKRFTATEVTITIQRRERIVQGTGDDAKSKYLVWSEEGETFEDVDTILFWKFNSSDVYGQLKDGHKYRVVVAGWRIPILSWYRNIIRVEEVK